MTTTVVNLRGFPRRGPIHLPDNVVRIDRQSKWGNPFRIGDPDPNEYPMDREAVISLYRSYAASKLADDPDYFEPLRGKRLACWCAPLPCHGDVIAEYLDA